MRRFAIAALIVATAVATPAIANTRSVATPKNAAATSDPRNACQRDFGTAGCADYQARLIRAVAFVAKAERTQVSRNEVSQRQLDALISTAN